MRRVLATLAVLALVYGALVLLVYAFQERLVYFPLSEHAATPRAAGFDHEDVRFAAEDGVRLHGWFVPAPQARATVLHLHGNGGNISHRLDRVALFRRLGCNTFLVDYRGYGSSEGRPTEEGTYRDALAAWRYLTEVRGIAPANIVIHGESLGGAVASWLAARTAPRALIVESSFKSAVELGAEVYAWLPVRWIARFRYPTMEHLARVRAPVLIVHSRDDEIVPFRHAEALYAAAPTPKRFLETSGDHNGGFLLSGERYFAGVDAFLTEVLETRAATASSE